MKSAVSWAFVPTSKGQSKRYVQKLGAAEERRKKK